MSESSLISRRQLLRKSVTLALAAAGGAVLASACKGAVKEIHCDDTMGLPPLDIATRKALEYVDRSPDPQKVCTGCVQYIGAPDAASCGGCKMFKGPVNPSGYCKVWQKVGTPPPS
jgi:hypothetical protein